MRKQYKNKSAVLHVIGDILGSVAAILASIIIMLTGWQMVDPILSVFVGVIILNSGYKILMNSCHILLVGTPEGISTEKIKCEITSELPEVIDVHHIHAWSLSDNYFIITMHARVEQNVQHTNVLYKIKKILLDKFEKHIPQSRSSMMSVRIIRYLNIDFYKLLCYC